MYNLYLDCDGVLLDTIRGGFNIMNELGIDLNDSVKVSTYFKYVNWKKLIEISGILDNSISKVKLLSESNIFKNISILTATHTYDEGCQKKDFFYNHLPNIKVNPVPFKLQKNFVVNTKNSILVDDNIKYITNWKNAGGIGVLFKLDSELNFNEELGVYEIGDLLEIFKVVELLDYNKIKVYKKNNQKDYF